LTAVINNPLTRLVSLSRKLTVTGEGPAAAAGDAERRNDGAVGRGLGISATQSVFCIYSLCDVMR